jgi:hypothetical protein
LLSAAVVALGIALIVQGVAANHGVNATKLVLGLLFVGAGTARLVVLRRRDRGG